MQVDVLFNRPDRPLPIDDLIHEIYAVKDRVVLASAWFTDVGVAQAIIECRAATKRVILNQGDLNREDYEAYRRIAADPYIGSGRHGSGLYILGSSSWTEGVMHHKFCLLDQDVVWTGSFNYTMQARRNYETLLRIQDQEVNRQFWEESETLVGYAPYRDDGLVLPIDGDFCSQCHCPISPGDEGGQDSGRLWCERCAMRDER